mgnify:CR=1 FL=1
MLKRFFKAVLPSMLAFAFSGTFEMRQKVHYIAALGFAFCYASTDEFHQLFVPGRSGQVRDVLIDSCGAAIGVLIAWGLIRIYSNREKQH